MPSGELLQVTAQQARGGCAVAEAFGRYEAVGGAAAQEGPQPGDLAGGARIEYLAPQVKGAGHLPEGSGRIALCVFGFGECRELLLACGAAVPDCPPPERIGFEGSAEDEASLAEREAGQGQEDAARRTADAGGRVVVPRGPHLRRHTLGCARRARSRCRRRPGPRGRGTLRHPPPSGCSGPGRSRHRHCSRCTLFLCSGGSFCVKRRPNQLRRYDFFMNFEELKACLFSNPVWLLSVFQTCSDPKRV